MRALRAAVAFDGHRFLDGGATVVVDGTRIVGVEPARYTVPVDCPVTEHAGTLLPGLVDAHVHLVADATPGGLERAATYDAGQLAAVMRTSLARQAAAGVTTVRDLGDLDYCVLPLRDAAEPGLPRIVAAGPPLTVPDGHCHYLGGVVDGPASVDRAVAERVERGVDVVKLMASGGFLTPGSDMFGAQFDAVDLRRLVDAAHAAGLRVLAHAHSIAGMRHALSAGVDGLEHASGFSPDGVRLSPELLDEVAAAGVTVDPTLGFDVELAAQMPPPPENVRALMARFGLTFETIVADRRQPLARMRELGIRVVSGLDAGAAPIKPHGALWRAVLELVAADWPVAEALSTATSVAADDCGLGDRTGRLRPGLDADLLLVDGDLRHEPEALSRPAFVMLRGQPFT